jgi:hypothetical protein
MIEFQSGRDSRRGCSCPERRPNPHFPKKKRRDWIDLVERHCSEKKANKSACSASTGNFRLVFREPLGFAEPGVWFANSGPESQVYGSLSYQDMALQILLPRFLSLNARERPEARFCHSNPLLSSAPYDEFGVRSPDVKFFYLINLIIVIRCSLSSVSILARIGDHHYEERVSIVFRHSAGGMTR